MTDAEVCFSRHVWGTTTWILLTVWHTSKDSVSGNDTWEETVDSAPTSEGAATPSSSETMTGFTVTATDCTRVWRGTADQEHVARHLVPNGLDADDYLRRTKHALTSSSSSEGCGVTVAPDGANATLWWRLPLCDSGSSSTADSEWLLDAGDAAPGLCLSGSLALTRVPLPAHSGPEALLLVADTLGARVAALETQKHALMKAAARRDAEAAHMADALAQLTAYKERLERDMYARLCAVLNEKKRRIRELTAQLENHKEEEKQEKQHEEEEEEEENTPTPSLDEDDLSDVVFAPDDSEDKVSQVPDLLGLRQPSSDLTSAAPVGHRRHRVTQDQPPHSSNNSSTSPARARQGTPQRKRSRRASHDSQLDADALFDNLD